MTSLPLAQVAAVNFRQTNLRHASLKGTRSLDEAGWGSIVCPNGNLNPDTRPCRR